MMRRNARGFSAVEALVATLLITIVLIAVGSAFSMIGRRADRENGRAPGIGGRTDVALERLERDLVLAARVTRSGSALEGATVVVDLASGQRVKWTLQA